jgi:hypothetical protein
MTIDIPRAGIFSAWLGQLPLTSLPRGQWSTLEFNIPTNVRDALLGDTGNARISIQPNIATCPTLAERQSGNVLSLDNLRFTGQLTDRQIFHMRGSLGYTVSSSGPLAFESSSDWSSPNANLSTNTDFRTQGVRSVGVPIDGYRTITSRPFSTSELSQVTGRLNLDLFIPRPVPNAWWYGDVALSLTCGNMTNQPIGQPQQLTYLFQQEFNSLVFEVPPAIQSVLRAAHSGCRVSIALNAASGAGTFLLDNMGFIQ